jgi:UDP-glucose 4-epimerase
MRVMITGGAGFIGSHLADRLLKDNHEVIILDNLSTGRLENIKHIEKKVEFINCDLHLRGAWMQECNSVDTIFHLAALADVVPSVQNPLKYYDSNVNGTFNILTFAKEKNINKFIYAASSSCYGIAKNYPTLEDDRIDLQYPYALSKRLGEELVMHWGKLYGIKTTSMRFFNVYGPRARTSGSYGAVFGVFLAQILANAPFTIVGDGNQTRDFTYVTDVAEALNLAMHNEESGNIFNVGSGKTVSINKIADLLGGKDYKRTFIPKRPGEPDCTFADITKIQNILKWKPKINIEDGVKMVLENIEYWREAPVWTPDAIAEVTEDWFKYLK